MLEFRVPAQFCQRFGKPRLYRHSERKGVYFLQYGTRWFRFIDAKNFNTVYSGFVPYDNKKTYFKMDCFNLDSTDPSKVDLEITKRLESCIAPDDLIDESEYIVSFVRATPVFYDNENKWLSGFKEM